MKAWSQLIGTSAVTCHVPDSTAECLGSLVVARAAELMKRRAREQAEPSVESAG